MTDDRNPFRQQLTPAPFGQPRPKPKPVDDQATRIGHTLGLVLAGLLAAAVTIGCLMLVAKLLVMLWVRLFQ